MPENGERLRHLQRETDFSRMVFDESLKMLFDLIGAKITLDDRMVDGRKLHHENTCPEFLEDYIELVFHKLRHNLRHDFARYEAAGKAGERQ